MSDYTPFPGSAYNVSLADLLARNIFGAQGVSAPSHTRIPFIFTSDLNLFQSGYVDVHNASQVSTIVSTFGVADAQIIADQTPNVRDAIATWPGSNNTNPTGGLPAGVAPGDSNAMIAMAVNPQSIRWDQPKRFAKKDTQTGSLFLFFSDQAGENNDILTLTMQGTTGNIDTRAINSSEPSAKSHAIQNRNKLIIWHKLYNLSRQPMYYTDNSGEVFQNNFYIIYRTLLMPFELRFVGFFSKVLEFTENATDPFKRDYTLQFTVTSTDPPLSDLVRFATSGIPSPVAPNTPGAVTGGPGTSADSYNRIPDYPADPVPTPPYDTNTRGNF
jgi:hypothetical protein